MLKRRLDAAGDYEKRIEIPRTALRLQGYKKYDEELWIKLLEEAAKFVKWFSDLELSILATSDQVFGKGYFGEALAEQLLTRNDLAQVREYLKVV